MVYVAIKGAEGKQYIAQQCAMKGGSGVPKQRWYWQIIALVRAHAPRSKTISCEVQTPSRKSIPGLSPSFLLDTIPHSIPVNQHP